MTVIDPVSDRRGQARLTGRGLNEKRTRRDGRKDDDDDGEDSAMMDRSAGDHGCEEVCNCCNLGNQKEKTAIW